ncbi:hypothetical protein [Bacillus sp. NEB1478]|uniref:hypothetical protein n=1 Tax=Bacillus sp. NEB1478 TaxID=3073816 RepID=UPI002873E819|nr:hypothetical protein [Bacillus sp. NEB1478]WNB91892.1 hypothetical protein RGB74_18885 [Bacillus sp. NEB1478]
MKKILLLVLALGLTISFSANTFSTFDDSPSIKRLKLAFDDSPPIKSLKLVFDDSPPIKSMKYAFDDSPSIKNVTYIAFNDSLKNSNN